MLLEDVFIIENLQVINEGKTGPMRVRGVFQRADEENNNGRIYPKALLEREITKLSESMKGRRLMGELDHPQHDSVKLSNVSHLITKLEAKGNEIIGEAEILDTPMGKVAKALIEGGVQVGISSRGMGTLSEGQDGKRYVNEDFRLITWDLVADPSTRGAFPALSESTNLNSMLVEEILNDVLPKVTKEKVFSTLLEETLNEAKKKKAKKKPAKKTKGGLPDFSRDGKITKADVLMGRGVIPKPGQKMKAKKVAREDSSTLFANVGEVLLEKGSFNLRTQNKQDNKLRRQRLTADQKSAEDSGVYGENILFPHFGLFLMEGGYLNEEFLNEGIGSALRTAGSTAIKAVGDQFKKGSATRQALRKVIDAPGKAIKRASDTFGRVKDSAKREGGLVNKAIRNTKAGIRRGYEDAKKGAENVGRAVSKRTGQAIEAAPKVAGQLAAGLGAGIGAGAAAVRGKKPKGDKGKGKGKGNEGGGSSSSGSSSSNTSNSGSSSSSNSGSSSSSNSDSSSDSKTSPKFTNITPVKKVSSVYRAGRQPENSSRAYERIGALLGETASSPAIRKAKHAKAQAKGSKTTKTTAKGRPNKYVRRRLGRKFQEDPEAVRSNEGDLAAARRFARTGELPKNEEN